MINECSINIGVKINDLREEISEMEIEYASKNDDKNKIRKEIQDLSKELEISKAKC